MGPRVLLLRTPETPPESDRYQAALTRASFRPLSLPVLETALENLDRLSRLVRGGRDDKDDPVDVDGVIVTSARAVDACANANANTGADGDGDIDWGSVRFYAVGPATAAMLAARLQPNPPQDVRGTESGTAERLAHYIVQDLAATREQKQKQRLLYLTGDKNRETLARVVREGLGGEDVLIELRVYATRGVRDFESHLASALGTDTGTGDDDEHEPWWIVFFAPSSASHVMPALRAHFSLSARESSPSPGENMLRRARLAAIGPTTEAYLREELGLKVDAVAEAPNADSLAIALSGKSTTD